MSWEIRNNWADIADLGTDVKIGDMDEQLRPVHEAIEQVGHYGLPVEQEYVLRQIYKLWFGEGYRPDKDRLLQNDITP